jgi:hypothetical protein
MDHASLHEVHAAFDAIYHVGLHALRDSYAEHHYDPLSESSPPSRLLLRRTPIRRALDYKQG